MKPVISKLNLTLGAGPQRRAAFWATGLFHICSLWGVFALVVKVQVSLAGVIAFISTAAHQSNEGADTAALTS